MCANKLLIYLFICVNAEIFYTYLAVFPVFVFILQLILKSLRFMQKKKHEFEMKLVKINKKENAHDCILGISRSRSILFNLSYQLSIKIQHVNLR